MSTGILERLSDTPTVLRSKTVQGSFDTLPAVGEQFFIYGRPYHEELEEIADRIGCIAFRQTNTSPIKEISEIEGGLQFETESGSLYKLTVDQN